MARNPFKERMNILFTGVLFLPMWVPVMVGLLQGDSRMVALMDRLSSDVSDKRWDSAQRTTGLVDQEWKGNRLGLTLEYSMQTAADFEEHWDECKVLVRNRDRVETLALVDRLRRILKRMAG